MQPNYHHKFTLRTQYDLSIIGKHVHDNPVYFGNRRGPMTFTFYIEDITRNEDPVEWKRDVFCSS